MTIEISILLTGISVAAALYFGLATKRRNERLDAKQDTEKKGERDQTGNREQHACDDETGNDFGRHQRN